MSRKRRRKGKRSKSIDWQAQSRTISFRIGPLGVEPAEGNHAGFWLRVLARLADGVWVGFLAGNLAFVATFALDARLDLAGHVLTVFTVMTTVIHLVYYTVWTAINGQSWGKAIAGIQVVNARGQVPSWLVCLWRATVDAVFILLQNFVIGIIDPLVAPFHRRRRTLHDLMCGTRVIRTVPIGPRRRRALAIAAILCVAGQFALWFAVIRPFVAQSYWVPSESMVPTLQIKDRLLANRLTYRLRNPRHDEIILFKSPPAASDEPKDYVKRLIGLPGDTIAISDGRLFRNGEWIEEELDEADYLFPEEPEWYLDEEEAVWGKLVEVDGIHCIRVPEGKLFVLGDNRSNSHDSHAWGYVPEENVIGKAMFRFWPLDRMGKL